MANLATLKAALNAAIYQNNQNAITGEALNTILNSIIDTLGAGYRYAGVATPSANPGTIDNRVFYFATAAGTYTNFGAAVLDGKSLHVFIYDTTWHDVALDVPTTAALPQAHNVDWSYLIGTFPSQSIEKMQFSFFSMGTLTSSITKNDTVLAQFMGLSAQATAAEVRAVIVDIIANSKTLKAVGSSGVMMAMKPISADNINPLVVQQNIMGFTHQSITADKCALAARYELANGWNIILFASAGESNPYCGLFLQPKKNIFVSTYGADIEEYFRLTFNPLPDYLMGLENELIRNAFLSGCFEWIYSASNSSNESLYKIVESSKYENVVRFSGFGGVCKFVYNNGDYFLGPENFLFYWQDSGNYNINSNLFSCPPQFVWDPKNRKRVALNPIFANPSVYGTLCDAVDNWLHDNNIPGEVFQVLGAYGTLEIDSDKTLSAADCYILFEYYISEQYKTGIFFFEL